MTRRVEEVVQLRRLEAECTQVYAEARELSELVRQQFAVPARPLDGRFFNVVDLATSSRPSPAPVAKNVSPITSPGSTNPS